MTVQDALRKCQTACSGILTALLSARELAGNESQSSHSSLATVRTDFISLLSLIYSHTTRVGLSFKPPITPPAAIKTLEELTSDLGRLASCALSFPASAGKTFCKEFIWAAQEVVECVKGLASGVLASFSDRTVPRDEYLRRVGVVHASVERLKAFLPVDQAAAVGKAWKSNSEAINDALGECKELMEQVDGGEDQGMEDEEEGGDGWDELLGDQNDGRPLDEIELERVKQVYSLLRFTSALHQKLIKYYTVSGTIFGAGLEARLDLSSSLTASIDELVASLPPPQDLQTMTSKVQDVARFSKTVEADLEVDRLAQRVSAVSLEKSGVPLELEKQERWFQTCLTQIEKTCQPLLS